MGFSLTDEGKVTGIADIYDDEATLYTEAVKTKAVWEETGNEIRYRVLDPELFDPDSFRRKRLEGVEGVSIIVARYLPDKIPEGISPTSAVVQAYRFDRKTEGNPKGWTLEDAQKWVDEHVTKKAAKATAAKAAGDLHTHFDATLTLSAEAAQSQAAAGDKTFEFTLCHAGTNGNGDHFTIEELEQNHKTAEQTKINLQHEQSITDIVGGVISSKYVDGGTIPQIDCVGELYTTDYDPARLAYKLMKKGIISQVSMECDYEEGECSICGKKVQSKDKYCTHLKKYKGGEYEGEPVFEILHGVRFTGLGLLDRKGADKDAKINSVSGQGQKPDNQNKGEGDMGDVDDKKKKKADNSGDSRVAELEKENKDLKNKVAELTKQLAAEKEKAQAAAKKARAEKLVEKMLEGGYELSEDEKESELKRFAEMDDAVFTATEATVDLALKGLKAAADDAGDDDGDDSGDDGDGDDGDGDDSGDDGDGDDGDGDDGDDDTGKKQASKKKESMRTKAGKTKGSPKPYRVKDSEGDTFENDCAEVFGAL